MAHDPYAPKRNPAAADNIVVKPPSWMTRQDRPRGTVIPPHEPPPISYQVEQAPTVEPEQQQADQPKPRRIPTDLEHIAAWIERLTWTDMKALAGAILAENGGKAEPLTAPQLGDMFEAWAAKTMKQHPERADAAANNPRAA